MSFKKCKVVMLPTNEKALIHLTESNMLIKSIELTGKSVLYKSNPQHFYILSDEEIKGGDWCLSDLAAAKPFQCTNLEYAKQYNCKKIIATTDTSLSTNSSDKEYKYLHYLPQPSQSFIEKFVEEYNKGNVITEVMVEYEEVYQPYFENNKFNKNATKSQLKISKNNTITIRKVKDSWNREEVIELLQNCWSESAFNLAKQTKNEEFITFSKWIEENL